MKTPIAKIKAANVEISKELYETITGNDLISKNSFGTPEASSVLNTDKYLLTYDDNYNSHQFMLMLETAFFNHKPVCISPDTIWLLICQGFSQHIKLHSDRFRHLFTKSNEKETITVRRDDFVLGKKNSWEEVIPEFTAQISKKINADLHETIVQNFSTTGIKEAIAFELAFMDSMSDYFKYMVISLCGIPEIHITGTVADYTKILDAVQQLRSYDLDWWIDCIEPHIQQFIDALQGKHDQDFWTSIYKHDNESGGPFVTGWMTQFFPYLETNSYKYDGKISFENGVTEADILKEISVLDEGNEIKVGVVLIKNPCLKKETTFKATLKDFPSSFSSVPVVWDYLGNDVQLEFLSGFIGVQENPENHALTATINWILNRK
ncbi:MAG: DUF4419 domain-containing protein [Kordia sp.]|uniref:DUF4419 domain-containing protein n=1 Tax=Kordia sp. TaxID=1965332 RepID=UPI00385D036A